MVNQVYHTTQTWISLIKKHTHPTYSKSMLTHILMRSVLKINIKKMNLFLMVIYFRGQ